MAVYNLNGYYKTIVRASYTLPSGHNFSWGYYLPYGSCGWSSGTTWSCAFDTGVYRRGA